MDAADIVSYGLRADLCREDALCSIMGIRGLHSSIFRMLTEKGGSLEVADIAKACGRDRTSVQRALQEMAAIGMVTRKRLPSKRGKKFSYKAIGRDRLRSMLKERLDDYYKAMKGQIDAL